MSSESKIWAQNYSTHSTRFLLEMHKYGCQKGEALDILETELLNRGLKHPFEPDRTLPLRPSEITLLQGIIFGPHLHGFKYSINCEIPSEIMDDFHISTSNAHFDSKTKVSIYTIPANVTEINQSKICNESADINSPIAYLVRWLAIIANTGCLIFLAFLTINKAPRYADDIIVFAALWLFIIINLLSLTKFQKTSSNSKLYDVWPFITIKRKTLEEREKINKLTNSNNQ